ncbi:unnamed protein product [Rhodiola kirilowii]
MALSSQSLLQTKTHSLQSHNPSLTLFKSKPESAKFTTFTKPISAVHAAEPAKSTAVVSGKEVVVKKVAASSGKWSLESWKTKKALQLPEYPNQVELDAVLKTIEDFPPIVFAGEARNLEDRLGEAAMGNAFLLQGGDCAESFKEFQC